MKLGDDFFFCNEFGVTQGKTGEFVANLSLTSMDKPDQTDRF